MTAPPEEAKLRRLLDVGRTLLSEFDTDAVLARILDEARASTGARYAAVGVLDEQRGELERFLTSGIDDATYRAIGDLPHGRGVLGVLIEDPRPLRLADVGRHPQSYGFPPDHPVMKTFLGVPILIRGQAWGNLYLTEKEGGGEFTDADEEAAVVLAQWTATAIENARLYESSERRREEAERAVLGLQAARDITDAIAGVGELDRVLELIVKRGRALVDARAVLIMLREGEDLVIAASAGHVEGGLGHRLPISDSTSGGVLKRGRPERISDVSTYLRISADRLGVPDAHTALLVPMLHRGAAIGVLAAFDHGQEGEAFSVEDEQLLRTFASSAANAVTIRRSVEADRLRSAITAADAERGRWARELHDQTLQALGGLRVLLAAAQRRNQALADEPAVRQAIEDIELEIENLRAIITDLRPSLLDDLGLRPAIDALLDRRRAAGLQILSEVALDDLDGLDPELETTIYRVLQEALTNIVKHAQAESVRVAAQVVGGEVRLEVQDDGEGFDVDAKTTGFGLSGMRERVYLAGGSLEVQSGKTGTTVRARLPRASHP
ncbi:MAG TPA: GAF domain-containing sensor histidine kinase [Solirubrobacteraceae bacterium]|nr:GAF domain-containing sensor histidine kinase [Solirubrobacteraceae bacterium]